MLDRGQTTFDFAIGVSVFLLAVAFVFSFVPGMVQPFTSSGQEEMAASNRLADRLATDALTDGEPYILDTACTETFFNASLNGSDTTCDFEGKTVEEALSLGIRTNLNVTLVGNTTAINDPADGPTETTLCLNVDDSVVEAGTTGSCVTTFATGDSVPESGSVITATRQVSIDGYHAKLVVRVW